MRLATIKLHGAGVAGIVTGKGILPVAALNAYKGTGWKEDMMSLIQANHIPGLTKWYNEGGREELETIPGLVPTEEVVYAPLYRNPKRIFGIGLNYADHAKDIGNAAPTGFPGSFFKMADTLIGPNDDILLPKLKEAQKTTAEAELGIIMGRDCRSYPREALRGKVAVVMQKAQLFGGTIRSNLLWGSQNASDADLWAALETAQAAEFVKAKPLGLDEPVEQGGRNLSGGQKQRLTIARALVGKPDILILDDSASALDYATDAALRKALAALPGDLTVFIVSQRAASLQHADQIIVLDDGRMVGLGRHAELLESCPVYKEIYESQFKKGDVQK